ncbi:hypothetical protein T492DRAFT_841855 [Pavlovales sp. CCMP2436]|nr:hypothetical protein T492DRAFT_841855 [Pavlovales sp. CCMP2436]
MRELTAVRSLAGALTGGRARRVRVRREGAPRGGGDGSCSAKRTSKVGLGKIYERQTHVRAHKAQHDSAKFGGMIFERDYIIARDPTESGRCDDPTESGRCDS